MAGCIEPFSPAIARGGGSWLRDADGHRCLNLQGGYSTPLYEAAFKSCLRVERLAHADSAAPRCEVLWISPHAADQPGNFPRFDTNLS